MKGFLAVLVALRNLLGQNDKPLRKSKRRRKEPEVVLLDIHPLLNLPLSLYSSQMPLLLEGRLSLLARPETLEHSLRLREQVSRPVLLLLSLFSLTFPLHKICHHLHLLLQRLALSLSKELNQSLSPRSSKKRYVSLLYLFLNSSQFFIGCPAAAAAATTTTTPTPIYNFPNTESRARSGGYSPTTTTTTTTTSSSSSSCSGKTFSS